MKTLVTTLWLSGVAFAGAAVVWFGYGLLYWLKHAAWPNWTVLDLTCSRSLQSCGLQSGYLGLDSLIEPLPAPLACFFACLLCLFIAWVVETAAGSEQHTNSRS